MSGDVLDGIATQHEDGCWRLISSGLAEAFGQELTLVVPDTPDVPDWAFELVTGTARMCVTHQRPLHAGARLAPGAPLDGRLSELVAVAVREDPVVSIDGLDVLQLVGITDVEYRLMQRAGTLVVLAKLAERDPLLVTDPARR